MTSNAAMSDRFRVSSILAQRLTERGISVQAVLRRAGLPAQFLQQEKIYVTTAQLFALWSAIGETSGDPAIGLQLGAEPRFERYDATQIAAVCSRTFRDALDRIARCKVLTCPEEIRVEPRGDETTVAFAFLRDEGSEPDVLVDVCLAWILAIGQRATDGRIKPLRVELARSTQHRKLLEKHFGCRVRFKARQNAIVFSSRDLDRPFVTYNEELLRVIGAHLESELQARQAASSVAQQVKQELKRSLAGRRPTRRGIAEQLHLSVRTLQRRLADAGTTFHQLVQDTRHELARMYLQQSAVELSEAAFLLGYEDSNSFFRAFHEWEGTSPGAWRARNGTQETGRSN
jgi:AraC-like DNA-binding protein